MKFCSSIVATRREPSELVMPDGLRRFAQEGIYFAPNRYLLRCQLKGLCEDRVP